MLWKYFKTYWFSIALVCILLLAIARKGYNLITGGAPSPGGKAKTEKFTESQPIAGAPSLLGLFAGPGKPMRQMPPVSEETAQAFLKRFRDVALSERKKFGTPASIMLACAYVNSFAGQRDLVRDANNYFALPCSPAWDGANAMVGERCYRRYETPWESFRDFSIHLSGQDWFGGLRKTAGKDWKAWVEGLHKEDISDVDNFAHEVAAVIQAYRLFELDVP